MNQPSKLDRASPSSDDADEEAIRALFEELIEGWNEGDGTAFADPFTENSDYAVFDGSHLNGRNEIEERHQDLFDTLLKGSTLEVHIESVRFLSAAVAVVHTTGGVQLRWQRRRPSKRDSIQTYVAVKQGEEWRFDAFQNTRIQRRSWLQKKLMALLQRVLRYV